MQEDQLYAMENYLSEYQQLVCKYRSENAALQRQLADRRQDGDLAAPPAQSPASRGSRSGPAMQAPGDRPQQQPEQDAAPTPGLIEEPDIPPLEPTSGSLPPPINLALYAEAPAQRVEIADQATAKELTSVEPEVEDGQSAVVDLAQSVRLRGEVIAKDEHGGPRLVVDVEAFESAGTAVQFAGTLSLMLLGPDGGEEPEILARWDFRAEEVRTAIDPLDAPAMRFYLELPAETAVAEPAELWVRLVMPDGNKLLTYAEVHLEQPSQFASIDDRPAQPMHDEAIQLAASESPPNSSPAPRPMDLDDGWTIARPGKPAGGDVADSPSSAWRASSEPIPITIRETRLASRMSDSTPHARAAKLPAAPAPPYKRPTWTAERPATANAAQISDASENASRRPRPSWSATR